MTRSTRPWASTGPGCSARIPTGRASTIRTSTSSSLVAPTCSRGRPIRRPCSHIEDRTRFPDLQQAAGSYNAKRQYLARTLAADQGIRGFVTQTHVMAGLWSAEVIHSVRLRRATFGALCPDEPEALRAWLEGRPPASGHTSAFVLLDPLASGRQRSYVGLADALAGVRPRMRGYADAVSRLSAARRA